MASREMVHRCLAAISGSALARGLQGSGRRCDGRAPLESRTLEGSVAVLPFVHGSSLVSLGHTQVLATVALGSKDMGILRNGYVVGEQQLPLVVSWEIPPYSRYVYPPPHMACMYPPLQLQVVSWEIPPSRYVLLMCSECAPNVVPNVVSWENPHTPYSRYVLQMCC